MAHERNKKIDITVLITSISQREITLETASYFSQICSEVILVDEEQPHLNNAAIEGLSNKGIRYFPYKNGCDQSLTST